MTTTKARPATRPAGTPRRSSARPAGGPPPAPKLGVLLRPLLVLLLVGLVAGALMLLTFVVLPVLAHYTISAFGATLPLIPLALAVAAFRWWRLGGALPFFRTHTLHLAGLLLIAVSLMGFGALAHPDTVLLGVALAEVSFTGTLGQAVLGEPGLLRVLRVMGPLLVGVVLVYPRSLRLTGTGLMIIGAWLASQRIPQRTFAATKASVSQMRTRRVVMPRPMPAPPVSDPAVLETLPDPVDVPATDVAAQGTLLPLMDAPAEEDDEVFPPLVSDRWELPAVDLLDQSEDVEVSDQTQRARNIEEALASYGVDAKVVQVHVGPAVTQFGLEPGWDVKYRDIRERDALGKVKLDKTGNPIVHQEEISRTRVKVERITTLSNNLALALAAPSVRIEAPVPGKSVVGIEVPNTIASTVSLRSVLESPAYQRLRSRSKLALALGKAVAGDIVVADLAKMPHLLIAGATGSGKSVCINTVICSIIMHASPDDVRFMMVDPKRVEMAPYNEIPHLLCPVIVEPERVVGTLQFVIREMEDRYRKFAAIGVRNIEGYNKSPKSMEHLPYWVIVIDELADLMMVAPYEVEKSLCRLAQLARATGIHLVVATQRPSVDVITGLIKANFPTRISFAVSSQIDSRTILDSAGAEKLLGRGDMLYVPQDANKPRRVQGCYVSDGEVERIGMYWADPRFHSLRPRQFIEEVEQAIAATSGEGDSGDDPLIDRARELAASSERISTSFLQRRLRIGYPRAARLMETLRDEGYGESDSDDDF